MERIVAQTINGNRTETLETPGNKEAQMGVRKQETLQHTCAGIAWPVCYHSCHCCHHLCSHYCEDSDPQNSLIPCLTHFLFSRELASRWRACCPRLLGEACRQGWIPRWRQMTKCGRQGAHRKEARRHEEWYRRGFSMSPKIQTMRSNCPCGRKGITHYFENSI